MLLSSNYRQNINFTDELIEQACSDFEKIERTMIQLSRYLEINNLTKEEDTLSIYDDFLNALADDFNTPNALMYLQQTVKEVNILMRSKEKDPKVLNQYLATLKKMFYCFGLSLDFKPLNQDEISLIKKWQQARNDKDFELADTLRKEINEKGLVF